jgi:LysM repeat protein
MPGGRRRSPVRLLAPLALLLAAGAVLVVIQASGGSDDSADDTSRSVSTERTTTQPERPRRVRATYTVKLNDTLEGIAAKTGVSVDRIQTLNPDLDPQNLIVGQKIKLRE